MGIHAETFKTKAIDEKYLRRTGKTFNCLLLKPHKNKPHKNIETYTNLRVLCFDIYAITTMCTPYYQIRLNLVSEICPLNIVAFSA